LNARIALVTGASRGIGARHSYHMGARTGERQRGRGADAAGGPGDESDTGVQLASASSESCRGEAVSRSVSGVG